MKITAPFTIPFLVLLSVLACTAQTPSFDVASIRPAAGNMRPEIQTVSGSLTIRNQNLMYLVYWAYDTPPFQITGPAFLNQDRFDVVAKSDTGGDEAKLRLMLRQLLADRFGLKAHTEQKEMQIYAVTLAKGGPKFQESTTDGPPVFDHGGPTTLTAHRVTMKDLALQISEPLARPVIDETGLKGKYEIKIDVSAYMLDNAKGDAGGPPPDLMSLLFTGLQQQLGIKLESKKQNVDILVVDHIEKMPTEN